MTNDVSPQLLLAFLNDAWNRAAAGANALRDQLVSDQSAALTFVKSGSLSSVGKNSAHQAYQGYGAGQLSQVQIVETISTLIGLYDRLKDKITRKFTCSADWGNAVPNGFDFDVPIADPNTGLLTQILSAMCAGQELRGDLTYLNLTAQKLPNQPFEVSW